MAMVVCCCSSPLLVRERERREKMGVMIARVPLRVPGGAPARLLLSSLPLIHRHYITIVQPFPHAPCIVFDFQPIDPENPFLSVQALLGNSIPGIVLERELSRLPNKNCWLVGNTLSGIDIEDARQFNNAWDTQLQLWKNDCRDHTIALVKFLTGKTMDLLQLEEMKSHKVSMK